MEALHWMAEHWGDLLQNVGIVGGLLLTCFTVGKDERARKISNSIALNAQYREIWKELYAHPELSRVLEAKVDLNTKPITRQEELFVTMLVLHLGTVFRAGKHGMFVKLEGMEKDVKEFLARSIPQEVWKRMQPFQDRDFVAFVEACRRRHF